MALVMTTGKEGTPVHIKCLLARSQNVSTTSKAFDVARGTVWMVSVMVLMMGWPFEVSESCGLDLSGNHAP